MCLISISSFLSLNKINCKQLERLKHTGSLRPLSSMYVNQKLSPNRVFPWRIYQVHLLSEIQLVSKILIHITSNMYTENQKWVGVSSIRLITLCYNHLGVKMTFSHCLVYINVLLHPNCWVASRQGGVIKQTVYTFKKSLKFLGTREKKRE